MGRYWRREEQKEQPVEVEEFVQGKPDPGIASKAGPERSEGGRQRRRGKGPWGQEPFMPENSMALASPACDGAGLPTECPWVVHVHCRP